MKRSFLVRIPADSALSAPVFTKIQVPAAMVFVAAPDLQLHKNIVTYIQALKSKCYVVEQIHSNDKAADGDDNLPSQPEINFQQTFSKPHVR